MKRIFNYILAATLLLTVVSCGEDEVLDQWISDNPPPQDVPITGTAGTMTLTKYVAIGNSLTAGFMDGALYNDGQSASYANMLATQFGYAGGGAFNQPSINSVYGYNGTFSSGENIAGRSYLDLSIPGPNAGFNGETITAFGGNKATLNNFGVPGARLSHLTAAGYGMANPYFGRFAANPASSSMLGDALATNPTFFSLWIGANDYLGYALTGGTSANTPLQDYSQGQFQAAFATVLGQLSAGGRKGVVLNLPPVVTLPLFQAVKWNAIPLPEANATALNTALAGANGAIQAAATNSFITQVDADRRKTNYVAGQNAILVVDNELTDLGPFWDNLVALEFMTPASRAQLEPYRQSRPLAAGELVLLSAARFLGKNAVCGGNEIANTPIGLAVPLGFNVCTASQETGNGDKYFLNAAEQGAIETARGTYNATIAGVVATLNANGADIALVDVLPMFVDILGLSAGQSAALGLPVGDGVSGMIVQGFKLTPDFAPSGVMSTDAVHPNPRGHAIVANLVIDAINARWGATIPKVDVIAQRGVYFSAN